MLILKPFKPETSAKPFTTYTLAHTILKFGIQILVKCL
jgi:hypothetical protein